MIRKTYIRLARQALRQKRIPLLLRMAKQFALIHASRMVGRQLCAPLVGMLIVTYRCNLRCAICDMPDTARDRTAESVAEFDTAALCGIIDEFAQMGVQALAFTGGEPLLRPDIHDLIAHARGRGMITHLATNGWLVGSDEARKLVAAGLDSIGVSLDGSTAEVNERTRSTPGAFERTCNALRHLVHHRNESGAPVRIKVLTVVSRENVDDIRNVIVLARDLGADGVELIPCQPLAGKCEGKDLAYDDHFMEKMDRLVAELTENRTMAEYVENSAAHLRLFRRSFEGYPSPLPCYAGNASLVIDCYGDAFPCIPWATWRYRPVGGNGRSLSALWKSKEYGAIRDSTRGCRRCYLNCHAELAIMLGFGRTPVRGRGDAGCR